MVLTIRQELACLVKKGIEDAIYNGKIPAIEIPEIIIEESKRQEYGHLATNVAFLLSKGMQGFKPFFIAKALIDSFPQSQDLIEKIEIAGGGFINFWVSTPRLCKVLQEIEIQDTNYGSCQIGKGERVLVEFLSANPTGPLHVGHGRGAAIGDSIANIFAFCGYDVQREYYINDVGTQMKTLGESLRIRYLQLLGDDVALPENYYQGEYLTQQAKELKANYQDTWRDKGLELFTNIAKEKILNGIKDILLMFRVKFDNWFSEKSLYDSGKVEQVLINLEDSGYTYRKDGALWLETTRFEDDKDRVLIRCGEVPTYFAGDIAYHDDKYKRGYDLLIDLWGADHHGYMERMKASMSALEHESDSSFTILLYQLVNLLRDNKQVAMSTRSGEFLTLLEVIDEVGVDACRFFFVMRKSESHLDFDLELAKKKSQDNPVYYIQYAHARCCSILNQAKDRGISLSLIDTIDLSCLKLEQEIALILKLSNLADEVISCTRCYEPHRLTVYLIELVSIFHNYYNHHRVISEDKDLTNSRLILTDSIRIVLRNTLKLLGVEAPERM